MTTANGKDIALRAQNVHHAFGSADAADRVVSLVDVSLDIRRGELISLIGPSGCGKTTLLNMFGGLIRPSSGTVTIDGVPVDGPNPKKVAYVFQEHALFPWNTVLDNLRLGLKFQGVPKGEADERTRSTLESVGLGDFADHFPAQLSGGMKQRAALARALCLDTQIILMDEPFAALDEQTRMVFSEDLSELIARVGKTILFVTHSLGEAVYLSDRIAVFSARPGTIKAVLEINEPHPRDAKFQTSERFVAARNELHELLREEIRKSVADSVHKRQASKAAPAAVAAAPVP